MKSLTERALTLFFAISCSLLALAPSTVVYAQSGTLLFQEDHLGSPWLTGKVVHDFGISMKVVGPQNLILEFGGSANCQASGGLSTWTKLHPTLDGGVAAVPGMEAMLGTKGEVTASIAGAGKLTIAKGTHVLGLRAEGKTFNASSPGCAFYGAWLKASVQQ
jgi:hypothetical protein